MSSRVTAPVSKLSRSLGTSATTRSSGLPPQYAELLRGHRRLQAEASSIPPAPVAQHRHKLTNNDPKLPPLQNSRRGVAKPFATAPPDPVGPGPVHLPATHLASSGGGGGGGGAHARRTPVPMMARPKTPRAVVRGPAAPTPHMPEVVFIAENPNNEAPSLQGLDKIDVDEVHYNQTALKEHESKGMARDIWDGLLDDVLGPKSKPSS